MNLSTSLELFDRAVNLIPGGVNSPVRACRSVGTDPLFIDKADGAYIYDADGNRFIDYIGSWGPMILGHAHHEVIEAVEEAVRRGLSPADQSPRFGCPKIRPSRVSAKACRSRSTAARHRRVTWIFVWGPPLLDFVRSIGARSPCFLS